MLGKAHSKEEAIKRKGVLLILENGRKILTDNRFIVPFAIALFRRYNPLQLYEECNDRERWHARNPQVAKFTLLSKYVPSDAFSKKYQSFSPCTKEFEIQVTKARE